MWSFAVTKTVIVRNGVFPAISVNKDVTVISNCSWMWAPEPKGSQEGEEYLWFNNHQNCSHSLPGDERSSGCKKHRYWPARQLRWIIKEWLRWAQTLASSHAEKCARLHNLCLVAQSCLTLCNPMDCRLPGSSVHGDFPGKNTGVGCHALPQGIFPTQRSNPGLPHCKQILDCLSHQGSPSLTWDICLSLINNNLLMFRLLALCCKTSIQLALLLTSLE